MSEFADNSSDVGSPMAGATDPASFKRMSDLGTHKAGQAPKGMQMLDGGEAAQLPGVVKPFKPEQFGRRPEQAQVTDADIGDLSKMVDLNQEPTNEPEEGAEQQPLEDPDAEAQEEQQPGSSVEELAAKYQEWMDSADLPEEMGDKVLWFDAGKGDMQPIRVRDIGKNILMYRDYQAKTAEVAERNRHMDRLASGHKQLSDDIKSGDVEAGLRAIRYMGGERTLRAIVMHYVQEQAMLETVPQHLQEKFLRTQKVEDENYFLKREQQRYAQEQELRKQQEAEAQGADAPDVKFVTEHILESLPRIYKQLGIEEHESTGDAFVYNINHIFDAAAKGRRNAQGEWIEPPRIKRGQTPSDKLIAELVVLAKQQTDKMLLSPAARKLNPPKKKAPPTLTGTGPAAKAGNRGNLSAPKQMRWSDMGKR